MISDLDDDLVLHVFGMLDEALLALMLSLNKRFHCIASEDVLWYALLRKELGEGNLPGGLICGDANKGVWLRRFVKWRRLDSCGCEAVQDAETDAPQARFLHRAACPTGRLLYIFGGQGEDGELNDIWMLDKSRALEGNAWSSITPQGICPRQRQSATLTALGHVLLMFGGRWGETTFMNDAWLFDTLTCKWTCIDESEDTWAALSELPTERSSARPCPRWAHSAVGFGKRVLIFGGSAPGRCFNDLTWFDSETLKWRAQHIEGRSPPARSGHCACAMGDSHMYVFGGNTTKNSFNDLWELDVLSAEWTQVKASGSSPSGRVGHTVTALGSRLLVLGGREYATNRFDTCLHSFDTLEKRWSQVPLTASDSKLPLVRTGHCTDSHEGRLLVFGGLCDDGKFLDDVTSVTLI